MRFSLTTLLAALLLPCTAALADTRVELLGRAADNGFRFYSAGTPWSGVRVGEYVYSTFTVTGPGTDVTISTDHNIQPLVQANVFNLVPNLFTTRIADIEMSTAVSGGPPSNPQVLLAHFYYQVDTIDLEGAFMPWALGTCCFPDGSCLVLNTAQCFRGAAPGTWTSGGSCDTVACAQPSGACCAGDNTCTISQQSLCSGTWTTGGSCVAGVTCPQFSGSCCSSNGACATTIDSACTGADQLYTAGGVCQPNPCQTLLIPGYVMDIYFSHMIPRPANAPVAWNVADFASIPGTYPGSLFDSSRSWLISFVGTDHNSYEMFVDIQRMVISPDTTATGSCCPGDGHCFVGTQAICGAGTWATGGACTPSPCPTSSGACCSPSGSCDLVTPSACAAIANSLYQGDGTSCATAPCGSTGACCTGGTCSSMLLGACAVTGGSWLGAGTSCAVIPQHTATFSITAGTCCSGNSCSVFASQYQCTAVNAVWTVGVTCTGTTCGINGACCNNVSGVCVMATNGNGGCPGGTWLSGTPCNPTPCASTGPQTPIGACCNTSTITCTFQNQASCLAQSGGPFTWSASSTCSVLCGTGMCCSSEFGSCTLETQAGCATHWGANSMSWTAGQACDAACIIPITYLHGPATTPLLYPINITDAGTASEVEVWVDVQGSSAANLFLELVGPNGASVSLVNRVGASNCTGNFVGASASLNGSYRFLDSATQSIAGYLGSSATLAPVGDYKPAGCGNSPASLNTTFAGVTLAGTWNLRVTDYRGDLRMYLRSWSISFNGGNPAPCTVGHCNLPQGGCAASTYAQCTGSWSIGPCSATTCSGGISPGACCYLNACTVVCQSQCPPNSGGGRFAGNGTACTTAICNVACCASSGACTITTVANCPGIAGAFASVCSPNTCPQPAACCGSGGACTLALPATCTSGGGTVGSATCTPNTCPGAPTPPANDSCAVVLGGGGGPSAEIVLNNGGAIINDTLVGATSDGVAPACAQASADVWYRFTPPTTGSYLIKTCGSQLGWDSVVSVWSNCTTQVPGACGDSGCAGGSLHASLTFPLTAGTPYLIRVGAYSLATTNIYTFQLEVDGLGACCIQNNGCYTGVCTFSSPSSCGGVHSGIGTSCTPNPCPMVLAQCCRTDNTCATSCREYCDSVGGFFGVIGTTCNPSVCPIGICCRGATCTIKSFYDCNPTGNAGAVISGLAGACGTSSTTPCCLPDYNKSGSISVQDIFDFLNDWFAGSLFAIPGGNGDTGTLNVQNIFDFLNAWFAGGC
jgi:hypothetical protein